MRSKPEIPLGTRKYFVKSFSISVFQILNLGNVLIPTLASGLWMIDEKKEQKKTSIVKKPLFDHRCGKDSISFL